jgi:prolyl oligopeptidase
MNRAPISYTPIAEPARDVLHGIEVVDPFRWLEDQNSPATRSFIRKEQQIYREYLGGNRELRGRIERRVTEFLTVATVELPISDHRGGLLYLKRKAKDEQKAIHHRNGADFERILISVAMLRKDDDTSLSILQVSPDGRYLVFGIRTGGEDAQEIGIYDLIEDRFLPDRLPRGLYRGLVFDGDQKGFYHAHEETAGRYQFRRAVRRHEFGSDPSNDREIFHAGEGPGIRLFVRASEDASSLGYLIVSLESIPKTRFLIQAFPLSVPPREIVQVTDPRFGICFWSDTVEASTTYQAQRGRIVRFSLDHPEPRAWTDLIPETGESLDSWQRWGTSRVIHYDTGRCKLTRIYSEVGRLLRTIEYPASGTTTLGRVDGCAHRMFYAHSDVAKPPEIYALDLQTGESCVWWQQLSPIGQQSPTIEGFTYRSKDGNEIPITIIQRGDTNGARPVLLSAYGGGGVSNTPRFSVLLSILLEAGFTCAVAHVRGGGEGGDEWHRAAWRQHKQTSVDDLVAAAVWLVENKYTTPGRLGVAGQSHGALLTLCAITQQPQRFRAAIALGPLADLTRFHLFGVARGFVAELGSPEDPAEFSALFRLSPYHNVRRDMSYPAVLIVSGDCDKRCDSLHARKMIARLREATPQNSPILLDYVGHRGHKPVLPLSERIRSLSDRLTFLIAELGAYLPREVPL